MVKPGTLVYDQSGVPTGPDTWSRSLLTPNDNEAKTHNLKAEVGGIWNMQACKGTGHISERIRRR